MNDAGRIVGTVRSNAVLWQDGQEYLLPRPPDPSDGFIFLCAATSIDRIGGYCYVDLNGSVAALAVRWVDRKPVRQWYPGAINATSPDGGVLAGQANVDHDDNIVAAARDSRGYRQLPVLIPGGLDTRALGVNDSGLVVGQSQGHAVVWRNDVLSPLTATSSDALGSAAAVNRWGNILGTQGDPDYVLPTMWKNGVPFYLGGLHQRRGGAQRRRPGRRVGHRALDHGCGAVAGHRDALTATGEEALLPAPVNRVAPGDRDRRVVLSDERGLLRSSDPGVDGRAVRNLVISTPRGLLWRSQAPSECAAFMG